MHSIRSTLVLNLSFFGLFFLSSNLHAGIASSKDTADNTTIKLSLENQWAEWKEVDTRFWFSSFDTYYNCNALANKFESLLVHYGAREDVKVTAGGCHGSGQVDNIISVRARFSVPEVIEQAEKNREDLANSRAFKVASVEKRINDLRHRTINNDECQVVEHFRDHLLKEFSHEITSDLRACFSGHRTTGVRNFSAITLSQTERNTE